MPAAAPLFRERLRAHPVVAGWLRSGSVRSFGLVLLPIAGQPGLVAGAMRGGCVPGSPSSCSPRPGRGVGRRAAGRPGPDQGGPARPGRGARRAGHGRLRGPEIDPRAYLCQRGWLPRGVKVAVGDPLGPHAVLAGLLAPSRTARRSDRGPAPPGLSPAALDLVQRCCSGCGSCAVGQAAHSRQTIWPPFSDASWLRWCTRKQREQVNSSAWRGSTRTDSSSLDRSAPGSSKPSACSVSSTSTLEALLSTRRAFSSSRSPRSARHRSCAARRSRSPWLLSLPLCQCGLRVGDVSRRVTLQGPRFVPAPARDCALSTPVTSASASRPVQPVGAQSSAENRV